MSDYSTYRQMLEIEDSDRRNYEEEISDIHRRYKNVEDRSKSIVEDTLRLYGDLDLREETIFAKHVTGKDMEISAFQTELDSYQELRDFPLNWYRSGLVFDRNDIACLDVYKQIAILSTFAKQSIELKQKTLLELNRRISGSGLTEFSNPDQMAADQETICVTTDVHGNFFALLNFYVSTGVISIRDLDKRIVVWDSIKKKFITLPELEDEIITIYGDRETYLNFLKDFLFIFNALIHYKIKKDTSFKEFPQYLQNLVVKFCNTYQTIINKIYEPTHNNCIDFFLKEVVNVHFVRYSITILPEINRNIVHTVQERNLGDIVDRGPASIANITFMYLLGRKFCMGNHEADQIEIKLLHIRNIATEFRNKLIISGLMIAGFTDYSNGRLTVSSHVAPNRFGVMRIFYIIYNLRTEWITNGSKTKLTILTDLHTLNSCLKQMLGEKDTNKQAIEKVNALIYVKFELIKRGLFEKFDNAYQIFYYEIVKQGLAIEFREKIPRETIVDSTNLFYEQLTSSSVSLTTEEFIKIQWAYTEGVAKSKIDRKNLSVLSKIEIECISPCLQNCYKPDEYNMFYLDNGSVNFFLWDRNFSEIPICRFENTTFLEGHTSSNLISFSEENDNRIYRNDVGLKPGRLISSSSLTIFYRDGKHFSNLGSDLLFRPSEDLKKNHYVMLFVKQPCVN
jgi:hypothetical protein